MDLILAVPTSVLTTVGDAEDTALVTTSFHPFLQIPLTCTSAMLLPPTELDDNPTPPAPFQNEEDDPVLLQKLAAFAIVPTTAEEEAIQTKRQTRQSIDPAIYLSIKSRAT